MEEDGMWNWKMIHDEDDFIMYCDIDNVTGSDEDEQGMFPTGECYQGLPEKIIVWISIGIKKREILARYVARRKEAGLSTEGYENYAHSLGLVELDSLSRLYRAIPAVDFDDKDNQLGTSSLVVEGGDPLLKGIKGEWSPVDSNETSDAIKAVYRFFYPPDREDR